LEASNRLLKGGGFASGPDTSLSGPVASSRAADSLYGQRRRWAVGLAQVLRRNAPMFRDWRTRRLWPVFSEAVLSIAWAYTAVLMIGFWTLSYAVGLDPLGANPVPNLWAW
jgi:cellulose synthase/poly-beta-1,6-N-acetylglucosamine synthase-like glycosyltransferase